MRRGRPEWAEQKQTDPSGVRPPTNSRARKAGGMTMAVVFLGIAAIIIVAVIAQAVGGDLSGLGGGLTGGMFCAAVGTAGLTMARTPSSAERA